MIKTVTYPAICKQPGICVSQVSSTEFEGIKLQVFRAYEGVRDKKSGFNTTHKYGDHHGKMFKTREECTKFCVDRGYLMRWSMGWSRA